MAAPQQSRGDEFVSAAACGDLEGVSALLADETLPADAVNACDSDGRSAFHYSCLNDDVRLLRVLLADSRVNVQLTSPRGDTGVHMAALYSSLEALKVLFEDGRAPLSTANNYGETPLHLCSGSGDRGAAKTATLLLEHGAALAVADRFGRGPLDVARDNGEAATVAVLEQWIADHPEVADAVGAVSEAHRARSAAPVQNDAANLAAKSAIFGQLGGVRLKKTTTTVKTMFRAGEGTPSEGTSRPPVAAPPSDGRRALSKLIDFPGDVEAIRGHLANPEGVNPSAPDSYGLTALHKFASWNKVDLMEMLLGAVEGEARVALINAQDPEQKTALHWAVTMASVGAVRVLVAAGADLSMTDKNGLTPEGVLDSVPRSGVIDRIRNALTGAAAAAAAADAADAPPEAPADAAEPAPEASA